MLTPMIGLSRCALIKCFVVFANTYEVASGFHAPSTELIDSFLELLIVGENGIGESLIEIKLKTQDDDVRSCVSELEGAGDVSALEKYYHRTCLRSAQRTFTPVFHSNVQVIRTA